MGIPEDAKKASIPLPKVGNLIERDLEHPRKDKWELTRYKFRIYPDIPHYGFLLKMLPDLFPNILAEKIDRPDKFKDALKGNKFAWFKTVINLDFPKDEIPPPIIPDTYKDNGKHKEAFAKTIQPLIVGLGEAFPYETGITLDFLTGLPIIPGSALKGIARRAAIMKLSGKTDLLPYGEEYTKVAQEYDQHEKIVQVFGTQDQKGKVIFMDAYPVEWPNGLFRVDVMNPHYGPYYKSKGKKPPGDWYNPVPVFYLTVNEGVKYRFIIAGKDSELLCLAKKWLEFALEHIGVGAKGSQGYGIFEIS